MQEFNMKYFAILVMLFVMVTGIQAGKIYKWVDENGQIHYSSQKPPGQEVETVKVKKGPKAVQAEESGSADKADDKDAPTAEDEEAEALAREQLAKSDAANKKKMCEQARRNIDSLNASVRVVQKDEKTGENVRMSDEQRVQALKKAQQAVKEYCQ